MNTIVGPTKLVRQDAILGGLSIGQIVYKAKGSTYAEMVAHMAFTPKTEQNNMPGQLYTMISGAKSVCRLKCSLANPVQEFLITLRFKNGAFENYIL